MKQYFINGAIALALIVAGYIVLPPVTKVVNQTVGSVAGPDSFFPAESHNGVTTYFDRRALATGTTTPYSYKIVATSTLDSFTCAVTGATSTAQTVVLTKGTAMQASTTAVSSSFAVAAGAQTVAISSSTLIDTVRTLNPGTFLQFNSFGGVGFANVTGSCSVRVTSI